MAHPLFNEIKGLVHNYLGIDKIIENIVSKLGDLQSAYIIGDYAKGKDTGTIELLLVGDINKDYLKNLVIKAQALIHREIKTKQLTETEFAQQHEQFKGCLLIWKS
ncbi:MAG: hypothetical protein QM734_08195 [Cyclobacteriaceae bacterium]